MVAEARGEPLSRATSAPAYPRAMRTPLIALSLALTIACATPPTATPDAGGSADAGPADAARVDAAALDATAEDAGADASSAADAATTREFGAPVALGTTPTSLPEISGIVASRTHPGVYWVENDSGNPPELYAIDEHGVLLATITVAGATNVDWEDIALAPGASGDVLYVADTGDNAARDTAGVSGRTGIRLYRLAEPDPALGDRSLPAEVIELRYPAQRHDCEAVFVDPASGDVYLVSKENAPPARLFVARAPLAAGPTTTLEDLGTVDVTLATAADMRRDGEQITVRNYAQVRVYDVLPGGIAASLASTTFLSAAPGSAAEAICFDDHDRDLLTIAEGRGATLFRIPRL